VFCCAFLWAKGLDAEDINKEMFPVYGGKCLSRKAVHNWVKKFSEGHSKVADDARPHRPVEIATEATVGRVEELIQADRRVMTNNRATAVGCSHGLAYNIMHDRSKFWKVCAR
jgi:transposase